MAKGDHLWKKGQPSPNPKGRPKGFSIVAHLKKKLQEIPEGQKETYAELIVKKYFQKALVDGDRRILIDLVNRVDGLPKQSVDMNAVVENINLSEEDAKKILSLYAKRDSGSDKSS